MVIITGWVMALVPIGVYALILPVVYECVAVMFVAQVMGIQLGLGGQFFVVVASFLTSVGGRGFHPPACWRSC
jgi:Na+/H+-dicarboxylate symporter